MKKYFYLIAAVVFICILLLPLQAAKTEDAKQLMERLYSPEGQEPVHDAIIDGEQFMDVSGSAYATTTNRIKVMQDKMFFLAPNKFRADVLDTDPASPLYGHSRTIIRDGSFVYTYVAFGTNFSRMDVDKPENPDYLPYYLKKHPVFIDYKYIYLGQEKINNQVFEVVGIFNPAAYVDYKTNLTKVLIDTQKWVPYRIEYTRYLNKEKKTTFTKRITYGDLRQLPDGRWWPFKITVEEFNDVKKKFIFESAMIYKRVAVNVGLEEDLFSPPKW